MTRKIAIVLRGAPATGKSTIARALRQHYGLENDCHVVLDHGWGNGEKRYSCCRYWDLRDKRNIAIIELCWGEPPDQCLHGATMNPKEWVTILEGDERELFFFLLTMSEPETERRLAERGNELGFGEERYKPGGDCCSDKFLARIGGDYAEETIQNDDIIENAVQRIVGRIGPLN